MPTTTVRSFYQTITDAVNDIMRHGFREDRTTFWADQIRTAAERDMVSEDRLSAGLKAVFGSIFDRMVNKGGLLKRHKGVSRFTVERLRPQLRAQLDQRVVASAGLIKLNRKEAIEKTLRRFVGWASSVPQSGSKVAGMKPKAKEDIRKSLASLPFEVRRVQIDQGAKFVAALSDVVAKNGNALGMIWRSHWRQQGYDYREDHKERDGQLYTIRGNWALQRGLMHAGDAGYSDEITQPGEEVFCKCTAEYVYNIRDLPDAMLTQRGRKALEEVRVA